LALRKYLTVTLLSVVLTVLSLGMSFAYEFWWPTSGWISSIWGEDRGDHYHSGIDIAANSGTPIYAACKGTIVYRGWYSGYGYCIDIKHEGNWVTRYAHQSSFASGLSVGSWVVRGQVIGYVGSTGNSTGPHLHFEIRQGVTFGFTNSYYIPGNYYNTVTAKTEIARTYSGCTCSSAPTWAATYRAQSFPSSMVAGSTAIVWAEFNNTGTGTWTHSDTYLGTSSPQDRSSPFCNTPNWLSCTRPTDVDQTSVGNGGVGRFTFILKAPTTPGTYTEKYRPVQEGVTWFGPEISWTITVTAAKGNLTGTVRNAANSAAISGATVSLSGGGSTTTNTSGGYTFSNINAGTYTINVSASGFNPASGSATVSSGATATKDFSLTPTDTVAPSAPSGLTATAISPSQINLSWTASTDNVGVTGYNVYRGGTQVGTATGTTFQDNGLAQNTSYSYTVKAKDAANNLSAASNTATATTHPGTVPIFQDGFANTNYWEALLQLPMTSPNPAVLNSAYNHGTFTGANSLKTVQNSSLGSLIGHRFDPAFAQAKFETWFFDGGGVGYEAKFEGTTDGWASTNQGGNAAYDTLVSVSGALRGGSSSDTTIAGWTSGCHKEITSGFAAGQPYSLTMSVKWPAAPAGKSWTTPPRCFVQFFDGAGGVIQTDYSANIATDNAWHAYSVSGTVPAGTAKIWAGHWGYVNATVTPLYYYADNVSFTTNAGAELNDASRQGLQVRCIDSVGTVRAIYYIGTYSASPGTFKTYSVGNYKVCGAGCTGWYWPGAAIKTRTAGWHKFTLDFLPYTGTGDVKAYIDGALVATLDRTLDTQTHGLNMVAYGYHYRVNQEAWFDDVAMYATQPHPGPTSGTPQALSATSIRWAFTDNSNNEIGFKALDAANNIKAVTGALTGTGSAGAIDEGGLAPNTQYTRTLRAFNGTLDSFSSTAVTKWTLAAAPTTGAIVCDKPVNVWTNVGQFTFTAVGGFGAGTVAGYRYVWNQNATYSFSGTETVWNSGDLPLPVGSEGSWYLHVQALNGEGTPGGTLDLGPYKYDGTAPDNPGMATETGGAETGVVQSEVSDPAFTWPAGTDALSGIQGYSVYFGDDSSGTSETFVTSAAYDPAGVSAGGTYYLRVRARDGAGNDADEWATIFTFIYSADAPQLDAGSLDRERLGLRHRGVSVRSRHFEQHTGRCGLDVSRSGAAGVHRHPRSGAGCRADLLRVREGEGRRRPLE